MAAPFSLPQRLDFFDAAKAGHFFFGAKAGLFFSVTNGNFGFVQIDLLDGFA